MTRAKVLITETNLRPAEEQMAAFKEEVAVGDGIYWNEHSTWDWTYPKETGRLTWKAGAERPESLALLHRGYWFQSEDWDEEGRNWRKNEDFEEICIAALAELEDGVELTLMTYHS